MARNFEAYNRYGIITVFKPTGKRPYHCNITNPMGNQIKTIKGFNLCIAKVTAKKFIDRCIKNSIN